MAFANAAVRGFGSERDGPRPRDHRIVISRFVEACRADDRIVAAFLYGLTYPTELERQLCDRLDDLARATG